MLKIIQDLKAEGKLNTYAFQKISQSLPMPSDHFCKMVNEGIDLTELNIDSEVKHKKYAYIKQHVPVIAKELCKQALDDLSIKNICTQVYHQSINSILDLYLTTESALNSIGLVKLAYPTGQTGFVSISPYNMERWMIAMRTIYANISKQADFNQIFDIVTQAWDVVERQDFKNWIRFYQSGGHLKYKTAQSKYYQLEGDGPPVIPLDHLSAKFPIRSMPNMDMLESHQKLEDEARKKEKEAEAVRRKTETRKKIISRLHSIERMISDPEAQKDLNETIDVGFSKWLEILHSLKRSIQTAPMRSASSTILTDLIIREANILTSQGYPKSGNFLMKFAQEAPKPPSVEELREEATIPAEPEPPKETEPTKDPLADIPELPTDLVQENPMGATPAVPMMEEDNDDQAMRDFIKRMNNEFTTDESESDDELVVEAQMGPDSPVLTETDLAVEEPEERGIINDPAEILSNVSMETIIERLELVADILRKKEIPRQLAIIDLMMDEMGIIGFFPELAEAQKSSLEANQYMASRIDSTLARVRTSLDLPKAIDLTSDESTGNASFDKIKQNLEIAERRDEQKKVEKQVQTNQKDQRQKAIREELSAPVQRPRV